MAAPLPGKRRPLVVGANHRSSSLALRDRLFVEDTAIPLFLDGLRKAGVDQAIILSTCDRVEVLAVHQDPEAAAELILEEMAKEAQLRKADLTSQTYRNFDGDAVRQIFAVAASLDSLMVGEPQVLGQVKAAHRFAREAGMVGPELEALMQAAYAAAKRVRTETRIGEGPVSIATAAVQIARDLHGDMESCAALLIGAGDMGELAGESLKEAGLGELSIAHPIESRADAAAKVLDCHRADFEALDTLLPAADIVITSLNQRQHVLTSGMVQAALKARRRKPIFIIDTGIPGDVEPAVNNIDGAFLYDLNDLERVAMEGRASRETEARDAWAIVDADVRDYLKGRAERSGVPALTALRDRFEEERRKALAEAGNDAEKATRLLINRLLHDPSEATREMAAYGHQGGSLGKTEWDVTQRVLMRLFRLNGGKGENEKKDKPE